MNFTQFLLILNARKWIVLAVLLTTVATTLVVSLLLPREYTATTTLIVDSKSKDPFTGQLLPSQMFPGYMATQVEVIKSPHVARKVVTNLKLAETPGTREQFMQATGGKGSIEQWLSDLLLRKLEVEPSRESSLIAVAFSGTDPQFAAAMANAFAQAYIQTNLELKVEPARQTSQWFDQQIAQLRTNLEQAQAKLSAYQREKGVVMSDERLDVETARLAELSGQVVAAQSAAYDAYSRRNQSAASAEVANNALVQNLKVQLAQSEARLAELERKTGKNHPEYQRAVAQLDSIRQELDAAIRTATQSVASTASAAGQRLASLRSAVAAQKAKVLELKQQRDEIAVLVRDVENAQRIYDSALQRYGQSRMEAQTTQTDIAVLNPAVPPVEPSRPRVWLNLLLSLFLGTLLGVGVGFLVELLDRRVRAASDIVDSLGLPLLGITGQRNRRRFWPRRAQPA